MAANVSRIEARRLYVEGIYAEHLAKAKELKDLVNTIRGTKNGALDDVADDDDDDVDDDDGKGGNEEGKS
jgi:hypothetical protein